MSLIANIIDREFGSIDKYVRSFGSMMTDQMKDFDDTVFSPTKFIEKDDKTYICKFPIDKKLIRDGDVKIIEKNGSIIIDIKTTVNEHNNNYTRSSSQSFYQQLSLPKDSVKNSATAKYEHGNLEIVVEKQK
jgi:HSP20 family molecular chaperone IbpA